MCDIMNKYLDNMFDEENTISEIDLLVADDEAFRFNHYHQKSIRKDRFKDDELKKLSLKAQYMKYGEPSNYAHRAAYDNGGDQIVPVFHGQDKPVTFIKKGKKLEATKVYRKSVNRKERHQKFHEEYDVFDKDIIDPVTGEVLAQKGEDWKYVEFTDSKSLAFENYINTLDDLQKFLIGFDHDGNFEGFSFNNLTIRELCPDFTVMGRKMALSHEIDAINDMKHHLLEEYADKIQKLNNTLKRCNIELKWLEEATAWRVYKY